MHGFHQTVDPDMRQLSGRQAFVFHDVLDRFLLPVSALAGERTG